MIVGAYTSRHEMTQVNGSVFIMDFTGVTAKHMTAMMNRSDMEKFNKFWQVKMLTKYIYFVSNSSRTFPDKDLICDINIQINGFVPEVFIYRFVLLY